MIFRFRMALTRGNVRSYATPAAFESKKFAIRRMEHFIATRHDETIDHWYDASLMD